MAGGPDDSTGQQIVAWVDRTQRQWDFRWVD
jgi:hypothetical protein